MYHFIINPRSRTGKGQEVWESVKQLLDQKGIAYTHHFTHYEFHAVKIAGDLCRRYPEEKTIVIVGGDGTVNEVINGIETYEDVILGYIPSGSSNDYARSLSIPKDPAKALEHILAGRIVWIDHGIIQTDRKTRRYAGSAGMGYDAAICKANLSSPAKKLLNKLHLGKLSYMCLSLKVLLKYKPVDIRLRVDHGPWTRYQDVLFVSPMNQPYEGGGFKMAPHADMSDGKLSACIIYQMPKWKAMLLLPLAFSGRHMGVKGTGEVHGARIEIAADEPLITHADGEYVGCIDHAVFQVTPRKIRMIV
ncbi:diacylglycerol/lipid kinase family protein [Anaerolentibacter hominis]|uniref:diacylglycerol/lipid kinase family protein n=1 Tax=Anaerolentibacter hominis TaxID=3079009 RepID=UPI0031B89037